MEIIYEKPRCHKCGFQNTLQNVIRHINSKKDVCKKYKGHLKKKDRYFKQGLPYFYILTFFL